MAQLLNKAVLPETAIGSPALLNIDDTFLALAWTGTDTVHSLNVAYSTDGHSFREKITINETSIDGPGFASGNGQVYLAWTGVDSQHHLNVLRTFSPLILGKTTLDETSPYGPGLTFGNGRLYLAWVGNDSKHSLNVMSSSDGSVFTNKVTLSESSSAAPSLSFIDGILYLLWQDTDADHRLNIFESTDGVTFTNKITFNETSAAHPALAKIAGTFKLAWTGRDAANSLNSLETSGSINGLDTKFTYTDSSIAAPTLAVFQDLYIAWTGKDTDHHVNVAALFPTAQDISPNTTNGSVGERISTAGVIIGLAGNTSTLYALSLNAGVWKSVASGPWQQLASSPDNGCCIAVDPNNISHIVVGERDGDAVSLPLNDSGVWESLDGGNTWKYTFNPLSLPSCTSQAVPAVAYSQKSTLFIGTNCGIGRKAAGASTFDFTHTPAGVNFVTAFSMSEQMTWARTPDALLASPDDGLTWTVRNIPPTVTVPQTVVGTTTIPAGTYTVVPNNIGLAGGNDFLSLAAVDSIALFPVKLQDNAGNDPTGNHCTLLIHDFHANSWQAQIIDPGDGRGLGGRRFAKAFILDRSDLPLTVGGRIQLFFSAAEDISRALGLNSDGTVQWDHNFLHTLGSGAPGVSHDPVHSDIWDFHLSPDGSTSWVSCDGGVYQKSFPSGSWVTRTDGLHTHHAQTLTVLLTDHTSRSKLAYPTADNDGWYRDSTPIALPAANWQHSSTLGDANWSAGDAGNPALALIARQPHLAVMTAFGDPPPSGANIHEGQGITLNNDETFSGPLFLQFIQTLAGESPTFPLLDAVMLVNLPLKDASGTPVPGPLGQPNPGGNPVLIRTHTFAANPDANVSKFQNWQIEANDLPQGTRGVWASGGHAHPTYYLYAAQPGGLVFYKRNPSGVGWQALNVNGLLDGGINGPAFVNPYDPNHLFVLTDTGIKVSTDGGNSFQNEEVLTALVTASGKFPLVGNFNPDGRFIAVGNRGRSISLGTLSHMTFFRDNPNEVAAASPFTGVFHTNGDSRWRVLTPFLPHPLSSVSSVGIDNTTVYAAFEGRSIIGMAGYHNAPLASYFQVEQVANQPGLLATLRDADKAAAADASIHLHISTLDGKVILEKSVQTNAKGQLFLPAGLQPGNHIVQLHFAGSAILAPSETAFLR